MKYTIRVLFFFIGAVLARVVVDNCSFLDSMVAGFILVDFYKWTYKAIRKTQKRIEKDARKRIDFVNGSSIEFKSNPAEA